MNEQPLRLNPQLESNVRHLKSLGYGVDEICQQLGIHGIQEIKVVTELCSERRRRTNWKGER